MSRRIVSLAVALFLCAGSWTVEADTLDKVRVSKALHLGHRSGSIPFSYLGNTGQPIGYAIDLCKHLAAAIAKEIRQPEMQIVWIPIGPNERNSALMDGLIDLDCGDSTVTAQSQKVIAFSIPIYLAGTRLLVPKAASIAEIGTLSGMKVVTTTQSGNEAMLRHVLGQTGVTADVVVARTAKAATEVLTTGQAQALFADDATLFGIRNLTKDQAQFTTLPKTYSLRPKALAYRKDDERLRTLVTREIKTLIASGLIQRAHEQWFNSPLPDSVVDLKTPISYLLRDTWKTPTDVYTDYAYGHLPD
ncbi:amino acid ABC transporter substrate-binding protein [Polaromonas sp. JS666]|uniref:amino acid ABC transporter substrate-binding protein n=1 Tax=Polaromonas sp. (strain JS666 / ATCC BAA-500) TaxID=296591 RepID=UPI0000D5B455|nr:amino acid ABC transporter substrate-binding protein [Polaromonas sp. JS666]ABE46240.1 amino acid ABC transporter substrate-binding protein, PAAT family [Polaromonas sp. JS666]